MFSVSSLRGLHSKSSTNSIISVPGFYTDGIVYSQINSGDYLYIGGEFSKVGSLSDLKVSRAAFINTSNANLHSTLNLSLFDGDVNCSVISGNFIYVGGKFTAYNGTRSYNLAKISLLTGQIDTTFNTGYGFNTGYQEPAKIGEVLAIEIDGTDLYVCGDFSYYNGTNSASKLAKLNANTGVFDSTFNTVNAFAYGHPYHLAVDSSGLYVSGSFTSYKGTTRQYLVKLNKTNATLDTNFDNLTGFNSNVSSIVIDSTHLYVGGSFTSYKGTTRQRVAKIDKTTGALDTGFDTANGFDSSVNSLLLDGNNLYVGGSFTTYKGNTRQRIVKIDKTTAAEVDASGTGFSTTSGFDSGVTSIKLDASGFLYAGGFFTSYKGNTRQLIAKIDKTTAILDVSFDSSNGFSGTSTNYGVSAASVRTISIASGVLFAGGYNCLDYRSVNNAFSRRGLAKIHIPTGTVDTIFNTSSGISSYGVIFSMILDGNNLYAGGEFTTYKGNTRQRIVKIDKTTAAEVDPNGTGFSTTSGFPSGKINSLLLDGNNLYVGGNFGSYKGNTRQRIVKIDKTTAAEVDANGTGFSTTSGFDNTVYSMALYGNNLYVGGSFTSYKGNTRQRIVKIDKTTAAEVDPNGTGFSTTSGFNNWVESIVPDGLGELYVGGMFSSYKGTTRLCIAKINATTASLTTAFNGSASWLPGGFYAEVKCILYTNGQLFIGGFFNNYNSTFRVKIAKINPTTGDLDTLFVPDQLLESGTRWYPGLHGNATTYQTPGYQSTDAVFSLVDIGGSRIVVSGRHNSYRGLIQPGISILKTTTADPV